MCSDIQTSREHNSTIVTKRLMTKKYMHISKKLFRISGKTSGINNVSNKTKSKEIHVDGKSPTPDEKNKRY